jgi:hypothetical protein
LGVSHCWDAKQEKNHQKHESRGKNHVYAHLPDP